MQKTMVAILEVKKKYQGLIFLNRDLNRSIYNISKCLYFSGTVMSKYRAGNIIEIENKI